MRDLVPAPSGRRYDVAEYSRLRPTLTLLDLHALWARARRPSPKTVWLARQSVIQFIAVVGDLPVAEIQPIDLFVYRDALMLVPRQISQAERAGGVRCSGTDDA